MCGDRARNRALRGFDPWVQVLSDIPVVIEKWIFLAFRFQLWQLRREKRKVSRE